MNTTFFTLLACLAITGVITLFRRQRGNRHKDTLARKSSIPQPAPAAVTAAEETKAAVAEAKKAAQEAKESAQASRWGWLRWPRVFSRADDDPRFHPRTVLLTVVVACLLAIVGLLVWYVPSWHETVIGHPEPLPPASQRSETRTAPQSSTEAWSRSGSKSREPHAVAGSKPVPEQQRAQKQKLAQHPENKLGWTEQPDATPSKYPGKPPPWNPLLINSAYPHAAFFLQAEIGCVDVAKLVLVGKNMEPEHGKVYTVCPGTGAREVSADTYYRLSLSPHLWKLPSFALVYLYQCVKTPEVADFEDACS